MTKCPFCDSEKMDGGKTWIMFSCGTFLHNIAGPSLSRNHKCYEAELARLKHPDYVLVRKIDLDGLIAAEDNPHELVVVRREDLEIVLSLSQLKDAILYAPASDSDRRDYVEACDRLKTALEPRPAPGRSGGGAMLVVMIGIIVGNFIWQYFTSQDYETAFERSYFQAIAVLAYWLYERLTP